MRKIILVIAIAALPAWVAAAEHTGQQPKKSQTSETLRPAKSNPCAAYGAGFVQVEGSSTCVKIGGSVTVEGGGRR